MKPEEAIPTAPTGVYRALQEHLATAVGQDFFQQLVRHLAVTLDVEYAFITVRKPHDHNCLQLVAGWHVNRAAAGGNDLQLEGTPAERTLLDGQLCCEDDAATAYPKDRWLRKHGVRAYCAVSIPGLDGRALGSLGVMSRQAFRANDEVIDMLRSLALRAAAELRRRHLDDLQRQSAIKFAASFRISPGILAVLDLDTSQCTDINPAVERLLGFSPAELIGRNLRDLGLWGNTQACDEILQELRAGGRIINYDVSLRTYTGEQRHGRLSAESLEFGQRHYALLSITDDTEFRATVDSLYARDKVYGTLFNAEPNPVLLFHIDASGKPADVFMDVNDAACQTLDYERDELRKLTPSALCQSFDWTEFGSRLIKEQAAVFEAELSCKNGALFICEVHARLISMPGDLAVMLVCRDTSHTGKKHDGGSEDSENNYRAMFEHALEGIYQTTTDGALVKANPALARILGYDSAEEMISSGINIASRVYVRPEQRADLLRRLEQDGHYADQEFQIFRRDGTTIWVCDNARAIKDSNGNISFYAGTLQDITGRKRAEEALVRSEEKYRTLVDMSQDGVFLSQGGKYVYVNRAFAYMLGFEPEDMPGLAVTDVMPESGGKLVEAILADKVGHRGMEPQEIYLRCR
ncbi:MAG: PAS domain S-box protein, partial [Gammaproteobacteria bacterium]|nr:PAS domain S-box protein [Gammaproteobacteria bacterium]